MGLGELAGGSGEVSKDQQRSVPALPGDLMWRQGDTQRGEEGSRWAGRLPEGPGGEGQAWLSWVLSLLKCRKEAWGQSQDILEENGKLSF